MIIGNPITLDSGKIFVSNTQPNNLTERDTWVNGTPSDMSPGGVTIKGLGVALGKSFTRFDETLVSGYVKINSTQNTITSTTSILQEPISIIADYLGLTYADGVYSSNLSSTTKIEIIATGYYFTSYVCVIYSGTGPEEIVDALNSIQYLAVNGVYRKDGDKLLKLRFSDVENKQDTLTFDTSLNQYSVNPVTNRGIYTSVNNMLANKMDNRSFDSTPTQYSNNLLTSGAVYTALTKKPSIFGRTFAINDWSVNANDATIISAWFGGGSVGANSLYQFYELVTKYTVKSGTTYYSNTTLTSSAGTLNKSAYVEYVNETYGTLKLNGSTYYVSYSDMTGSSVYLPNTQACADSWAELKSGSYSITLHGPITPYEGKIVYIY